MKLGAELVLKLSKINSSAYYVWPPPKPKSREGGSYSNNKAL